MKSGQNHDSVLPLLFGLFDFLSFLPPDLTPKFPLPCDLQSHRQQQKDGIRQIKQAGERCDPVQDDPRIVVDVGLVQQDGHPLQNQAGKHHNHKAAVPVIETVNGKGGPALQGIPAAFHRRRTLDQVF